MLATNHLIQPKSIDMVDEVELHVMDIDDESRQQDRIRLAFNRSVNRDALCEYCESGWCRIDPGEKCEHQFGHPDSGLRCDKPFN
ncbi:hypothetical protein [Neptuniibacter sp. QD37_11]|uniref:hypothetical protein n=1 Tax=Neptuniibacter sp. QD37_11 TaxID=3398209 RepID=UPI0039F4682B